jgi:ankyrin repeat protein
MAFSARHRHLSIRRAALFAAVVITVSTLLAVACKSAPAKRTRSDSPHHETEKLREALYAKDFNAARAALAANANPNESYTKNEPWLFVALEHGLDWAELFYENGADLENRNSSGFTALLAMTDNRKHDTMRWLLKHGADANHVGKGGFTALLLAYIHDDALAVKILKDAGAREDIFTHSVSGNAAALRDLLAKGADPNQLNSGGRSALSYASGFGRADCVRVLLEFRAHINHRNPHHGGTALLNATKSDLPNKIEILSTLIASGADVNIPDKSGATPLIVAAFRQDNDALKVLVESGAQVNAKAQSGARALAYVTDAETEKLLLARGAKCGNKPRFTCGPGGQRAERSKVRASDGLYLRDQPSIEGKKLALMPAEASITILSRAPARHHEWQDGLSGVWYRVRYKKLEGYAFSAFIE